MKLGITLLLLAITSFANAQSLKDMLYKGKLKKDSTSVIRKTDDLSTKMVDTTKKAEAVVKVDSVIVVSELITQKTVTDTTTTMGDTVVINSITTTEVAVQNEPAPPPPPPAPVKSNNKIWKEYTDSLYTSLKAEVLTNKKVKKETYYVTVDYEIGLEGEVTILNVTASPENEFLQNQVKDRLMSAPPVLPPNMDSSNKPRKVKRKYNFTITKD